MNQIKSIALAALLLAASACAGSESSQVDEGQADGTVIPTIAITDRDIASTRNTGQCTWYSRCTRAATSLKA